MHSKIEYYEEYLKLKFHFNSKEFMYGKTRIPGLQERYDKEKTVYALEYFQKNITMKDFKRLLVANFIVKPKLYLLDLKKDFMQDNLNKWLKFQSNRMLFFKRDLELMCKELTDLGEVKLHHLSYGRMLEFLDRGDINFDTVVYIDEYSGLRECTGFYDDLWKKYGLRIDKYKFMFNKMPMIEIEKTIKEIFN